MEDTKEESVFETFDSATDEKTNEEPTPEKAVPSPDTVVTAAPEEASENQPQTVHVDEGEKQWYVINTYSGREKAVADALEKRKDSMDMKDYIYRIVVAQKEEPSLDRKTGKPIVKKNGEIKTHIVNSYPGYIFVEAIMSERAWYVIRNTQGVTGLVGSKGQGAKPIPVSNSEMIPVLKSMNLIVPEVRGDYSVGEKVHIIEGAFADSEGEIVSVDQANGQADVSVQFFGRPNTVTVPFASLEKEAE